MATDNVIEFNKGISPQDVLEQAMRDVRNGIIGPHDKIIILHASPAIGKEVVNSYTGNMNRMDMIAMLEITKLDIHKDMTS